MQTHDQHRPPVSRTIIATTLAAAVPSSPALAVLPVQDGDLAFSARPDNPIGIGSSVPASDQASNISEANTHSRISPRLPEPETASDSPQHLLHAALRALHTGRTGEAQEALERAETRLLSHSVYPMQIGQLSTEPSVSRIAEARQSLGRGDLAQAAHLAEMALPLVSTTPMVS